MNTDCTYLYNKIMECAFPHRKNIPVKFAADGSFIINDNDRGDTGYSIKVRNNAVTAIRAFCYSSFSSAIFEIELRTNGKEYFDNVVFQITSDCTDDLLTRQYILNKRGECFY